MPWRRRNREPGRFLIMIVSTFYLNIVCYIQMFERLIICFTYVENCSFSASSARVRVPNFICIKFEVFSCRIYRSEFQDFNFLLVSVLLILGL